MEAIEINKQKEDTTIRVTTDVRKRLNVLKAIKDFKSLSVLLDYMIDKEEL